MRKRKNCHISQQTRLIENVNQEICRNFRKPICKFFAPVILVMTINETAGRRHRFVIKSFRKRPASRKGLAGLQIQEGSLL